LPPLLFFPPPPLPSAAPIARERGTPARSESPPPLFLIYTIELLVPPIASPCNRTLPSQFFNISNCLGRFSSFLIPRRASLRFHWTTRSSLLNLLPANGLLVSNFTRQRFPLAGFSSHLLGQWVFACVSVCCPQLCSRYFRFSRRSLGFVFHNTKWKVSPVLIDGVMSSIDNTSVNVKTPGIGKLEYSNESVLPLDLQNPLAFLFFCLFSPPFCRSPVGVLGDLLFPHPLWFDLLLSHPPGPGPNVPF